MKNLLSILAGMLMCIFSYSQSELHVFEDWVTNAGTQNFLIKSRTITDASKNVYVVGATLNGSGNYDILVAKYDFKGGLLWINQYNGAGNGHDVGTGIDVDASGNVYITGTVTTATSVDLIVIRYSSSGVQLWLQTYNGTGNFYDAGADVKLVTGVNFGVYVTGSSYNASGNTDFLTIKYSPSGVLQWANVYDHTTNMNDAAVKVVIRPTQVVVTGAVQTATSTYRCAIVRYDPLTGLQIGAVATSSTTSNITEVNDMFIDASDNIYITGTGVVAGQGNNFFTFKLNSSLVSIWEEIYNGAGNLDDVAKGIQVDGSGNVFVTGYTTTTTEGRNYATIKYNTGGVQQWVQFYNDALNADDEATGIALDNSGNAYVTGYTTTAINQKDFYTIKYNTSGTMLWEIGTDGDKHLNDISTNIVIDNAGDIIVAGQSETVAGKYEYLTVKYVEKNVITPTDFNGESAVSAYSFYKNKGQLLNTSNADITSIVKYYTNNTEPMHYIGNLSSSYVFANIDTISTTTDTMQRIDFTFNGNVNPSAKVYPLEERSDYISYFLGHIPDGITEIHANKRLVTSGLYSNIDVEFSSNSSGIKYYFIIKPGGNPTDIQLEFTGASTFNINGTTNELTISSLIGNIKFDRPTVYQLSATNVIIPITGWTADWQTNGASNKYKFNIGTYDNTKALIIEVDEGNVSGSALSIANLEYSTFYGGSNGDGFFDVAVDGNGNSYATGNTLSTNFPITSGVLQDTLTLNDDAIVVKFDALTLANTWATFYGGSSSERGNSVKADASQEVYVTGYTNSFDFPVLNPIQAYGGSFDGFVFKLNSSGTARSFGTHFGGGNFDQLFDIALDNSGNLYAVGFTYGSVPTQPQAGTTTYTTGAGIILKLSMASGSVLWASQYGGTFYCRIRGVTVDQSDNVYLTGGTRAGGFIQSNPNFIHPFGGTGSDVDAFITKLNSANNLVWSSFYGGNDVEYAERVAINSNGDIAFVGHTVSSSGFPVLNAPSGGTTYGGSSGLIVGEPWGDAFIAVFNSSGTHLFGTYFGDTGNEGAFDVSYDTGGNLYLSGYTTSSTNSFLIPSPNASGAYADASIEGANDAFIACFNPSYNQIWGTYFGGHDVESGYGIATYQNNKLFVAGLTQSAGNFIPFVPFPLVNFIPGVSWYSEKLNVVNDLSSGNADGFLSRFDLAPIIALGVEEDETNDSNIKVYPNPTAGEFNLEIENINNAKDLTIKIYNAIGQIIYFETINKPDRFTYKTLDFSYLSSGLYMLTIELDNNICSKKLMKN